MDFQQFGTQQMMLIIATSALLPVVVELIKRQIELHPFLKAAVPAIYAVLAWFTDAVFSGANPFSHQEMMVLATALMTGSSAVTLRNMVKTSQSAVQSLKDMAGGGGNPPVAGA